MSVVDWFHDSGHAAFAACAISVVAIVVSIAAWVTSWRTQKRQVTIEEARERDRIVQTRKAILVAKIVREPTVRSTSPQLMGPRSTEPPIVHSTRFHLEIENKGMAAARDISVTLDDAPLLNHAAIKKDQEEVAHVGGLSSFRYELYHPSRPHPRSIKITWSDDSGEPGHYETPLT